jgi:hypothetical protein
MIIISVVSSEIEFNQLLKNSFLSAEELGFTRVIASPENLDISNTHEFISIKIPDFSSLGEVNLAKACSNLDVDEYILHVDPDEFFSKKLLEDINRFSLDLHGNMVGCVKMVYLFNGKQLFGTPWGGLRNFPRIAKPETFAERRIVHTRINGDYVDVNTEEVVKHFWVSNFAELESKHIRYLQFEGESMMQTFGAWKAGRSLVRLIRIHFGIVKRIRFADGIVGIKLSFIFSCYSIRRELELRRWKENSKSSNC